MNDDAELARAKRLSHGQICYVQMPTRDIAESARFYQKVFGWQVESPHSGFEAPGLIGQWVTDRPPAAAGGPLLWINVERLDDTLALVLASGGQVLGEIMPDGPRRLATISDPAGNTLGVAQHRPL